MRVRSRRKDPFFTWVGLGSIAVAVVCLGPVTAVMLHGGLRLEYGPFHQAIEDGNILEVRRHLDRGTSANLATKNGFSALFIALLAHRYEVAALLVSRGADVNKGDSQGSLLYEMAIRHEMASYRWLLKHGAKPDKDAEYLLRTGIRSGLSE